jgi:hypothetical protein
MKNELTASESAHALVPPADPLDVWKNGAGDTLQMDVLVRTFYHEDRLRFFLFVTRTSQVMAIILGSATFASLTEPLLWLRTLFGALSVIAQTVSFVFGFGISADNHRQKRETYARLLADFEEAKSDKDFVKIRKAANQERATESVTYWAVEVLSWNRAYYATTRTEDIEPERLFPVSWWESRLRNLRGYSLEYFRRRKSVANENRERR